MELHAPTDRLLLQLRLSKELFTRKYWKGIEPIVGRHEIQCTIDMASSVGNIVKQNFNFILFVIILPYYN